MEYEYTKKDFKLPSYALAVFKRGVDLFVRFDDDKYILASLATVIDNHNNLYIRKEAIDYQVEFAIDTPWMVSDNLKDFNFSYALMYDSKSNARFRVFADGWTAIDATDIEDWKFARHLTREEEVKYLGAVK